MPRIALNKATLHKERSALETYRRFLPSLDLKRKQLMFLEAEARRALARTDAELEKNLEKAGSLFPMLGNRNLSLEGLVRVADVHLGEENQMGVDLPVLDGVDIERENYSYLVRPHWVDPLADCLEEAARLRVRRAVEDERLNRLSAAVTKVTQRVNLFEKVLMPQAEGAIHRILIFLSDTERAAIIRAKFAKRRHAADEGKGTA